MLSVDPMALARRQVALDRARAERFPRVGPALLERKLVKMTASPLGLLRGSAPLFYDLLRAHPTLAEGPRGKGWLAGDLHLENFGAYRVGPGPVGASGAKETSGAKKERARGADARDVDFDLNDFDEGFVGPWRLDVLRLATSLILGGRELGAGGRRVLGLARGLIEAYVDAAFGGRSELPPRPAPVARLVEQVAARTRGQLLDARTQKKHGARHFVRGDRYLDLPDGVARRAGRAFEGYVASLEGETRPDEDALRVIDSAWRIAGTGSLGCVRIALLVRGKGGDDGGWIFDLKEETAPAAVRLVGKGSKRSRVAPAERVILAMRACLARPPRLLGTTTLGSLSMLGRRLSPQEDKLDLAKLADADLDPLAAYLGALVGRVHARGATKAPRARWTAEDQAAIVDRAIAIAGIHEAVYLAMCKLASTEGAP